MNFRREKRAIEGMACRFAGLKPTILTLGAILAIPALVGCNKSATKTTSSPDLAYNELKGPVKMVTLKTDWGEGAYKNSELFYDSDGNWLNLPRWEGYDKKSYPNYNGEKSERDKDGYIVKIYDVLNDEGSNGELETTTLIWENGRLKQKTVETHSDPNITDDYSSSQSITTYTYDDKGLITHDETNYSYNSSWGSSTNTTSNSYAYTEMDENGNWTKRNVSTTYSYDNMAPTTSNYTEIREILYY